MEIKIGKPLDLRLMEQGEKRRGGSRSGELRAKIIGLRNSRKMPLFLIED